MASWTESPTRGRGASQWDRRVLRAYGRAPTYDCLHYGRAGGRPSTSESPTGVRTGAKYYKDIHGGAALALLTRTQLARERASKTDSPSGFERQCAKGPQRGPDDAQGPAPPAGNATSGVSAHVSPMNRAKNVLPVVVFPLDGPVSLPVAQSGWPLFWVAGALPLSRAPLAR